MQVLGISEQIRDMVGEKVALVDGGFGVPPWEMRKRLIKDSGAWYSLIGREGVRFYRRAAFRRASHSQGIEQVISLCHQINISFTTQCDQ